MNVLKSKKLKNLKVGESLKGYHENVYFAPLIKNIAKEFDLSKNQVLLEMDNVKYTLNKDNYDKLIKGYKNENVDDSYKQFRQSFIKKGDLKITLLEKKKDNRNGSFFTYFNKTIMDLSRYGIYKNESEIKKEYCLYQALKNGGLNQEKLDLLNTLINYDAVKTRDLNNICERLNIQIILSTLGKRGLEHKEYYGKENQEKYNVALVNEHYFIQEDIYDVSEYALNNYNTLKNEKNFLRINKYNQGWYRRQPEGKSTLTSFNLVNILLENKNELLEKMDIENLLCKCKTENDDIKEAHEVKNEDCEEINMSEKKELEYKIIYIDFETYIYLCPDHKNNVNKNNELNKTFVCDDSKCGYFTPYQIGYYDPYENEYKIINGEDCGLKLLNWLKEDSILIAHNASFDGSFLIKYLNRINEITNGNDIMENSGVFYNRYMKKNINIVIKDSYKLIPMKLKMFSEIFKLKCEKEVMPYKIYSKENIENNNIDLLEFKKYFDEKDYLLFIDNCKKWNCINNNKVNIIKYSGEYCKIDVKLLKEGYEKFSSWMKEINPNININNTISISSLAHLHMIIKNCYNNIYKIGGNVRQYIQKCLVGSSGNFHGVRDCAGIAASWSRDDIAGMESGECIAMVNSIE